jgi:hypothetical protein
MPSKGLTTVAVVTVIALTAFAAVGYLLYAIPQSNADSLSKQVATLRAKETRLARQLALANRRAASAGGEVRSAFARGHAKGLADAAATSQSKFDAGFVAGNTAAFGQFGGDWTSGTAYLVLVKPGAGGSHQIAARAALQECQAVYARNGSVYVQGPAC